MVAEGQGGVTGASLPAVYGDEVHAPARTAHALGQRVPEGDAAYGRFDADGQAGAFGNGLDEVEQAVDV